MGESSEDPGWKYLSKDVFACVVVRPGQFNEQIVRPEDHSEDLWSSWFATLCLDQVDSVLVAVTASEEKDAARRVYVVVKYRSMADRDRTLGLPNILQLVPKRRGEATYYCGSTEDGNPLAVLYPEDKFLVVGQEQQVLRILEGDLGTSPVIEHLEKTASASAVAGAMVVESIPESSRRALNETAALWRVDKSVENLANVRSARFSVSFGDDPLAYASIEATDEQAAQEIKTAIQRAVFEQLPKLLESQSAIDQGAKQSKLAPLWLIESVEGILDGTSAHTDGTTVNVVVDRPSGADCAPRMLIAILMKLGNLPLVRSIFLERRQRLGFAEAGAALTRHIGESDFPPRGIPSDSPEPLLSWRVAMLPGLYCRTLYGEFHLDEPWDSPHNLKLLKHMPTAYGGMYDESTLKLEGQFPHWSLTDAPFAYTADSNCPASHGTGMSAGRS
ncbi:MAG: hypothetical protein RIC55_17190 [Pirellulaceae bacterium]